MEFIAFYCPVMDDNEHGEHRHLCGGVSRETLESYDFVVPWVDTRYCGSCRRFFVITLESRNAVPRYSLLPKGERLDFTPDSEYFTVCSVEGN
ncbi:MAG: hypothetical protein ABIH23_04330 [bacterium]